MVTLPYLPLAIGLPPAGRGAAGLLPGGQEQPVEFEGARVVEAGSFPCPGYGWVGAPVWGRAGREPLYAMCVCRAQLQLPHSMYARVADLPCSSPIPWNASFAGRTVPLSLGLSPRIFKHVK